MAEERKRKLGKGVAFVKTRIRALQQGDEVWEADFRALPTPISQSLTHYHGLVVTRTGGSLLAELPIQGRPSADDLAMLLAHAMRGPLVGAPRRPSGIHLRGHKQWKELFPVLEELGMDVSIERELPKVEAAYKEHLRRWNEARRAGMVKPSAEQTTVETMFPAIARWVDGCGHVEIGDQETFGFVARALDYGGLVFEDDRPKTLAEAMAALEKGLTRWFEEEGEDVTG